jgi:hypothetical protein
MIASTPSIKLISAPREGMISSMMVPVFYHDNLVCGILHYFEEM